VVAADLSFVFELRALSLHGIAEGIHRACAESQVGEAEVLVKVDTAVAGFILVQ